MCRVLIADDEPKVLLLIRNLIEWEQLGLELVATANDGISALALIEAHRPDIVITDIRMPGHDGIELIGRAKALCPTIDFIIISGYRHFDYAQKAIRFGVEDYLLKPLKAVEINQTLRKMIDKYRLRDQARQREADYSARLEDDARRRNDAFIAALLRDETPAVPADLSAIKRDYALAFVPGCFQGFVVKADVDAGSLNDNVRRLLQEKTAGVIRDALSAHCHVCLLHPADDCAVHGVINFDAAQKKALRRALVGVIDALQAQGELFDRIKVTVGLGRQTDDPGQIASSCHEARRAVADRLIVGTGRIIDHAEGAQPVDVGGFIGRVLTVELRRRLLQGIEILDAGEVFAVIDEVARAATAQPDLCGGAVLALFEEIRQALSHALKGQNALDAWIDDAQRDALEKLGMCHAQRDVFALLASLATGCVEHVIEQRRGENAKPIREAQKYIAEHYAQPIGLEAISLRAGFNPTYFSALFKKETGMNFIDYLIDVRIREAKRLLADPRKTIADVAQDVGYSDVKHFSRVFTRSTGIQPSKYRKLYY
jgi:two-component system response regulator YesN